MIKYYNISNLRIINWSWVLQKVGLTMYAILKRIMNFLNWGFSNLGYNIYLDLIKTSNTEFYPQRIRLFKKAKKKLLKYRFELVGF